MVLDKTGTLSLGPIEGVEIHPANYLAPEFVVKTAAIAERFSEQPIAAAILRKASALSLPLPEPEGIWNTPGKGVRAKLGGEEIIVGSRAFLEGYGIQPCSAPEVGHETSQVFVAQGGSYIGLLRLADTLRAEAKSAVDDLRGMGVRALLLTGDQRPVAGAVAQALGVDQVEPELLPDQKLERIQTLRNEGRSVAMVGNGMNDAPALVQATVGVAMGSGTDVARESADVVLFGNHLFKFVQTIEVARRCRGIIMTNFVGTLLVDGLGAGLAAFGLLNRLFAAFIHVSSERAFILNSARLLPQLRQAAE